MLESYRTYDDDEFDELYEEGLVDECGVWINNSTIIAYRNNHGTY